MRSGRGDLNGTRIIEETGELRLPITLTNTLATDTMVRGTLRNGS